MHEIQSGRNGITRTEVIPDSAAHVHREREVLSLSIGHSLGALRVDISDAEAYIKIGSGPPVTRDKVTPNPHDVREIATLRSSRNRGNGTAERQIEVPA